MKDLNFLHRTNLIKDGVNYGEIYSIIKHDTCYEFLTMDMFLQDYSVFLTFEEVKQLLLSYKLDLLREGRQSIINERKISKLVHFTKIDSLEKIAQNGITTISEDESIVGNDRLMEELDEYVNTSCSFPNYKLFYKRRMENKLTEWAVISINPQIIIDNLDTIFLPENAGKFSMICKRTQNPNYYKTNEAFNDMFAEEINGKKRSTLISPFSPTDPQAEILIARCVNPEYFSCITVRENAPYKIRDKVKSLSKSLDIRYRESNSAFSARADYKQWQNK